MAVAATALPAFACKYIPLGYGKKFGEAQTEQLEKDQKRWNELRKQWDDGCTTGHVLIDCGITTPCRKVSEKKMKAYTHKDGEFRHRYSTEERQAIYDEMKELTDKWSKR